MGKTIESSDRWDGGTPRSLARLGTGGRGHAYVMGSSDIFQWWVKPMDFISDGIQFLGRFQWQWKKVMDSISRHPHDNETTHFSKEDTKNLDQFGSWFQSWTSPARWNLSTVEFAQGLNRWTAWLHFISIFGEVIFWFAYKKGTPKFWIYPKLQWGGEQCHIFRPWSDIIGLW